MEMKSNKDNKTHGKTLRPLIGGMIRYDRK